MYLCEPRLSTPKFLSIYLVPEQSLLGLWHTGRVGFAIVELVILVVVVGVLVVVLVVVVLVAAVGEPGAAASVLIVDVDAHTVGALVLAVM